MSSNKSKRQYLLLFSGGASAIAPVLSGSLDTPAYGVAYSDGLTATGTAPITWTISAGALPTGLTINASTGAITGIPTASGAFSPTIRATNAAGYAEQAVAMTVSYASKVLFYEPIAYWQLDETSGITAEDSSGNNRDGTYYGVTLNATTSPTGGTAGTWDGVNDYVDVFSTSLRDAMSLSQGSILFWLRIDSWTAVNRGIIEIKGGANVNLITLYRRGSSFNMSAEWIINSNFAGSSTNAINNSTDWHCGILTWDIAADRLKVYIDNVERISITNTTAPGGAAIDTITLGKYSTYHLGSLAHVAIYATVLDAASRTALATP